MRAPADTIAAVLESLKFAARKHRDQRRKGNDAAPYINHPIEVTELLAGVGGITDVVTLQGGVLHDTLEDTDATPEELERCFGPEVRHLVEEVSDDKRLPKEERKRLQVEHAPGLSDRAKRLKLADKTSNVRDVTHSPPAGWSLGRRREYLRWTERVVAGCRGASPALEAAYDEALRDGLRRLDEEEAE